MKYPKLPKIIPKVMSDNEKSMRIGGFFAAMSVFDEGEDGASLVIVVPFTTLEEAQSLENDIIGKKGKVDVRDNDCPSISL